MAQEKAWIHFFPIFHLWLWQLAFKLFFMPKEYLKGKSFGALRILRIRQKVLGNIAAVFFGIALLAMADGLIAGMRAGSARLEMLPGQQLAISGPAATKNPLPSDVIAKFSPVNCPLEFHLEGFFTGYWFGSGMWRGMVHSSYDAGNGLCRLSISFRGMPAKSAQHYEIYFFENERAMQEASLSLIRRFFGVTPFYLALSCAIAGFLSGLLTYFFGRIYVKKVRAEALLAVYSPALEGDSFLCIASPGDFKGGEAVYPVYDECGQKLGSARAIEWRKGKWRLAMNENFVPASGSLVGTRKFLETEKNKNINL